MLNGEFIRAHPNTIDFIKTLKSIQTLNRGKLQSNNLR